MPTPKYQRGDDASLDSLLTHIGRRIRELREMQGVALLALEEFCGVDARQLMRIEAGEMNITVKTADRIARALGVPTYELFVPAERSAVRPKPARKRASSKARHA